MGWLITSRKFFSRVLVSLNEPLMPRNSNRFIALGYFLIGRFASAGVWLVMFLLEIPLHLFQHSTESFAVAALRGPQLDYRESYSSYLRRQRFAVASVLTSLLLLIGQLTYLGYTVVQFTIPTKVAAQTGSLDLNPTWDDSVYSDSSWQEINPCLITDTSYTSEGSTEVTMTFGKSFANPADCDVISNYHTFAHRPALNFSLASIPNSATITGVSLLVNVSNSSPQQVSIMHPTSDALDTLTASDAFFSIENGTSYATATWSTTGAKTVSLGSTAVSDVQARIATTDLIALGLKTAEQSSDSNNGIIGSVNNTTPANRPILRVTYTVPPSAPTSLTHSGNTTNTLSWTWTDNASSETRYDVRDGSGNVAGCTNLAANSTSCTETGLSANTSYTRTVRVTDAEGTTDSSSATFYTSIQTPTGVSASNLQTTSISVSADGSISNLGVGQAALWFEETLTATNSGWITSTIWTKTGLQPNTLYTFRVKARNSDGDETAFTATSQYPTIATSPDVTGARATSTWFTSGAFTFTSNTPFGSGGVEYYRYLWNTSSSATALDADPSWCVVGCDVSNTTLSQVATDGASWYLHLSAYDQTDTQSGGTSTSGPYFFDNTAPSAPSSVNDGTGADSTSQTSTTSLSGNWTASSDATSGVARYEYAIGTTAGGTEVRSFTNAGLVTSITASSLSLAPSTTYFLSVRAVDTAGNTSAITTSNGITVSSVATPSDTTGPTISDIIVDTTSTTATVRWSTSEDTTASLAVGLTTGYGQTVERSTFASTHQLAVTGLTPSTTYHFRLTNTDASGNQTRSSDDTFTTVAASTTGSGVTGPTLLRPVVRGGTRPSITITGVGKGNQTITFYVNDRAVKSVHLDGELTTTKSFAVKLLADIRPTGKYVVTATATQGDGRVSEIRQRLSFRIGLVESQKYVRPAVVSTYIVHAGDTLWDIAEKMLGDGSRWTEIATMNTAAHPSLASSSTIQPDWALTIPAP